MSNNSGGALTTLADALHEAFTPGTELTDPRLFAGRRSLVFDLARVLRTPGEIALIYGERGLGKSSLAIQAERIALGDTELLDEQDLGGLAFGADDHFIVEYISCTSETKNLNGLITRIMSGLTGLLDTRESKPVHQLSEKSTTAKLSVLSALSVEHTRAYELVNSTQDPQQIDANHLQGALADLVDRITDESGRRLLIVVDELDLLESTKGLAGLLKALSGDLVRFMLVGIGHNVDELLADHRSLRRKLVPIEVLEMNRDELEQIFDLAADRLTERGVSVVFDRNSKIMLADLSMGFPWLMHVVGLEALMGKARRVGLLRETLSVDEFKIRKGTSRQLATISIGFTEIDTAVSDLSKGRFARQFETDYEQAVGESRQRETVLRALAHYDAAEVSTSRFYKFVRDNFDISDPGRYKAELSKAADGELITTRGRKLRFRNRAFRNYVVLRESMHDGVGSKVQDAWRGQSRAVSVLDDFGNYRRARSH